MVLKRILKAYIIAVCFFLLMTLMLAAVIHFTSFHESWAVEGLTAALSVTSLLLGLMTGMAVGRRGLLTGLASAVLLLLMIRAAAAGIFPGEAGAESLDVRSLIPLLTGAAGGVLGANQSK